ncbi:MAG: hypothetical protein WD993_08775 [Thermoleophilaceae bacterium]
MSADVLALNGFQGVDGPIKAREPAVCVRCSHTVYRGRIGLYELMEVTDELRALIVAKRAADEIAAVAVGHGMRRLPDDGLAKVRVCRTSRPELLRVLGASA